MALRGLIVTRPFWSILFLRYTTNELPGYCQGGRLAMLHPFLLGSDGPGPRRYSP